MSRGLGDVYKRQGKPCLIADSFDMAVESAGAIAGAGGRTLVTGSFYTVGPFLERLSACD